VFACGGWAPCDANKTVCYAAPSVCRPTLADCCSSCSFQEIPCLLSDPTTDRTAGVRSPTEAEDLSSNLSVQTGSGAHPATCTVGTGGSFPGGKARRGRDADHSPLPVPRLRKSRSYTSCHPDAPLWSVTGPLHLYLLHVRPHRGVRPRVLEFHPAAPKELLV
jgi:hypothetical protein